MKTPTLIISLLLILTLTMAQDSQYSQDSHDSRDELIIILDSWLKRTLESRMSPLNSQDSQDSPDSPDSQDSQDSTDSQDSPDCQENPDDILCHLVDRSPFLGYVANALIVVFIFFLMTSLPMMIADFLQINVPTLFLVNVS